MMVSIIMPVYNGEKYLSRAIESVLDQTFKDFEFIILNDGSTDKTQDIIESYKDERIKSHYHPNMGVAKSLNRGLELANGEYIWRHDADDFCLKEQLQKQLEFLKKHPSYALVSTQIAFATARGKVANDYRQPNNNYFNNEPFIKVTRNQFNPYSPITHATVLVKKEVFDTVGVYRTDFKTSEDTDLWLRIIEHYNAAVMNYCSYFVRLNETSATQVHKKTNTYYRDMAFQLADERAALGEDLLQRGESLPMPKENHKETSVKRPIPGKVLRTDLLNFRYKVALNAKDYKAALKMIKYAIRDGYKLRATWRGIVFPILGKGFIERGVKLKRLLK